jgi:hypothetical protein
MATFVRSRAHPIRILHIATQGSHRVLCRQDTQQASDQFGMVSGTLKRALGCPIHHAPVLCDGWICTVFATKGGAV